MDSIYIRRTSVQQDTLANSQEVEIALRQSGSQVNLRTLASSGSSSSNLNKSSGETRPQKNPAVVPTMSYGHVGGRISGSSRTTRLDCALLGAGTVMLALGLMCIMTAGRVTLQCDMAWDVAGRQADVCRITQEFGFLAPGTFFMSHSRSLPLASIERPVVLMQAADEELVFQRVGGSEGHHLQRLHGVEYRDQYDQYHDDIDVEDEDVLRQHKCLLGVQVVHDGGAVEHVACSLVQQWCLGPEMDQGMHSIEQFLEKKNLTEEELEVVANGADRAVSAIKLEDNTRRLPQVIGFILFILGVILLIIYQVGGMHFLCSVVPQ